MFFPLQVLHLFKNMVFDYITSTTSSVIYTVSTCTYTISTTSSGGGNNYQGNAGTIQVTSGGGGAVGYAGLAGGSLIPPSPTVLGGGGRGGGSLTAAWRNFRSGVVLVVLVQQVLLQLLQVQFPLIVKSSVTGTSGAVQP
jgi:hypothetical protein